MKNVDHHDVVYVDMMMLSNKVLNEMHSRIDDIANVDRYLYLNLLTSEFVRSQSLEFSQILSFVRRHLTNNTLSIAFHFRNEHLFFIIRNENRDDRNHHRSCHASAKEIRGVYPHHIRCW